jgi:hypothetical protein
LRGIAPPPSRAITLVTPPAGVQRLDSVIFISRLWAYILLALKSRHNAKKYHVSPKLILQISNLKQQQFLVHYLLSDNTRPLLKNVPCKMLLTGAQAVSPAQQNISL